jgi:uncharacterized membrane protein YphA (DoxX/SURF4 family)
MMQRSLLLGILLLAIGAVIVLHGLTEGTERSVLRIGNVQTSVEARRSVPTWVGAFAIVGGALLVGAGLRRRSHDG